MKFFARVFTLGVVLGVFFIPQVTAAAPMIKHAFGVNIHLHQRVPVEDQDAVLLKAKKTGVQWGREEFRWNDIEPVDGVYVFDDYDDIVNRYEQNDIQMLGLLTYSAAWASTEPGNSDAEFYPPDNDAWKEYVGRVAEHYAGRVPAWEIWNEPNHSGFWKGTVDDYVQLVTTAAKAIHAQDPDAKVVLGGLSGADSVFLDAVLSQLADTNLIDVVAIHPYRFLDGSTTMYMPEDARNGLATLETDLHGISAVLRKHGLSQMPVWLTEIGAANGPDANEPGMNQQQQACYLLRIYTIALSEPHIRKVFWYTLTDSDTNATDVNGHFGLFQDQEHHYAEKLSVAAYQFAKKHLNRKRLVGERLPNEQSVDQFDTRDQWSTADSVCTQTNTTQPTAGRITIAYAFTADTNCYAVVSHSTQLPMNTQMLQLQLRGSNDDTVLRLRIIDANNETFQYTLGTMPNTMARYTLELNNVQAFWGGNGNGVPDQPLRFDSLIIDDKDGSHANGEVTIDELLSSTASNEYLYQFHGSKKSFYAYWSSDSSIKQELTFPGVQQWSIARFGQSRIHKTTQNGVLTLRANQTMAFLMPQ
ncbi:MAG: endo-1,4-beta-xylanase [Candidatus Kerfeldbacteria bacterium]|nr:endo-1,4-beta-xylanase [Candidatus Kerfeldbacteria bacterium]